MSFDISVIIPHKNNASLLQRCIDSIPADDRIEVIVVDDHSDGDKVSYAHFPGRGRANTKVVFASHSGGAGYARNVGLREATGRWLLFADCDDYFAPDAFLAIMSYIDSDADIVFFKSISIEAATQQPYNDLNNRYNSYIDQYLSCPSPQCADMLKYNHEVPWGKLIRHSMVADNDIRFDEIRWSNDTMFATRIALKARRVTVDGTPVYVYMHNSGSLITQLSRESFLCRYEVQLRKSHLLRHSGVDRRITFSHYFVRRILSYPKNSFRYGIVTFWQTIKLFFKYL